MHCFAAIARDGEGVTRALAPAVSSVVFPGSARLLASGDHARFGDDGIGWVLHAGVDDAGIGCSDHRVNRQIGQGAGGSITSRIGSFDADFEGAVGEVVDRRSVQVQRPGAVRDTDSRCRGAAVGGGGSTYFGQNHFSGGASLQGAGQLHAIHTLSGVDDVVLGNRTGQHRRGRCHGVDDHIE